MSGPLTINLSRPITSARILGGEAEPIERKPELDKRGAESAQVNSQMEAQKAAFAQSCQTLNSVINMLNQFCARVFAEHSEKIAKLSVEIARKILVQKVENGDYEIESIVKETLKNAPSHQDLIVHLNPDDLTQFEKVKQNGTGNAFAGIKFVPDQKIGRAECLLESPKGIIESLIDEHLEQIGRALTKTK
jgi:flagellar biosynthesis/type III secretory pathway protein FliH